MDCSWAEAFAAFFDFGFPVYFFVAGVTESFCVVFFFFRAVATNFYYHDFFLFRKYVRMLNSLCKRVNSVRFICLERRIMYIVRTLLCFWMIFGLCELYLGLGSFWCWVGDEVGWCLLWRLCGVWENFCRFD